MAEPIQIKNSNQRGEDQGGLIGLINKTVELTASVARQVTSKLGEYRNKLGDYKPRIYNAFQLETEFAGNGHYDSCQGGGGCQCQSGCQCQRRD